MAVNISICAVSSEQVLKKAFIYKIQDQEAQAWYCS